MRLALDAGNSFIKVGLFNKETLIKHTQLKHGESLFLLQKINVTVLKFTWSPTSNNTKSPGTSCIDADESKEIPCGTSNV